MDSAGVDTQLHQDHILIVEDNLVNQKVILGLLKKFGYGANTVKNGKEAINAISDMHYDLVFMDCQMPVMDGYDATREIRTREGDDKHTVIIAMTANAMPNDREKCFNVGMDDYISKPINPAILKQKLSDWLEQAEDKMQVTTPA